MAEVIEIMETVEIQGNQVYQQDFAAVNSQIATAKKYPRDLSRCIKNCVTLVTMDAETAESCTYSLKKGGKVLTGPSVHLARIILQQFGNIRAENRVVGYDATHVTCEAIVFDLETNFAMRTQIKKSIVGNNGRFSEDMCTIIGNAGNAISLRNAAFAVIPKEIVNKIYKAALQKITGDVSDATKLMTRTNLVIEGLKSSYSVQKLTDEEILASIGKASVNHITAEDIAVLIGYENSLKTGETTFESVFRPSTKFTPITVKGDDKSEERILQLIAAAKTEAALEKLKKDCSSRDASQAYDKKMKELKQSK